MKAALKNKQKSLFLAVKKKKTRPKRDYMIYPRTEAEIVKVMIWTQVYSSFALSWSFEIITSLILVAKLSKIYLLYKC